jgi:hypothetical protein
MFSLAALLVLAACDNNTELAKPTPPPVPLEVSSATPAQVKLTGTLDVISVKNGSFPVASKLQVLDGELALRDRDAWSGASGKVEISLISFDSTNPVRDDRVRNTLLQVGLHPTASFELTGVSGLPADGIPVGSSGDGALSGHITLAGATQAVQVPVVISRTGAESWEIATAESVGLSLRGFGLQGQTEALRAECGHESIADVVHVDFQVTATAAPPPAPSSGPAVAAPPPDE